MRRILEVDLGQPAGGRRAGRHQPRRSARRWPPVRLLLRAGPVQPAGLLDRRQRGGELRRRALPQVRVHHQPRDRPARWSLPTASWYRLGGKAPDAAPGYDLLGVFVGSEGTLGIATKITVRLTQMPEAVTHPARRLRHHRRRPARRCPRSSPPASCPAAIEMMDALAIEAAEAAVHVPLPGGRRRGADRRAGRARRRRSSTRVRRRSSAHLPSRHGAFEIRDRGRRGRAALIWKGRKSAFAAVGRISPDYIVQDGVIPRTALPEVLRQHRRAVRRRPASGWPTCSTPATATCTRWCSSTTVEPGAGASAAEEVSGAILDLCIEHGGSITGEHGVGVDKAKYMPRMFTADDLDTMQLLRCAFDPRRAVQPGQGLPDPAAVRRGARLRPGAAPAGARPAVEQFDGTVLGSGRR